MAMDGRIEELVAVGASVTASCGPCLRFHVSEAQRSGATAEEIAAAIAVGKKVREGAATKMDQAVAALGGSATPAAAEAACCAGAAAR